MGQPGAAARRAGPSAAGLDLEVVEAGNVSPDFEGGVAVADLVLAAAVTSVIAYNDMVGLGLISRFGARGVTVPGDVSIIGFDDIPASALVSPCADDRQPAEGPVRPGRHRSARRPAQRT